MDKEESITTNTTNTTTTTTNNTSDSDSQMESSPLRFHPTPPIPTSLPQTPLRNPPQKPISMAIVATDQAPIWLSPPQSPPPPPPPLENKPTPQREPVPAERLQVNPLSPVIVVNRLIREELAAVGKIDGVVGGGRDRGVEEERGSGGRRVKTGCSRDRKEGMVNRAALSFRVLEVVFCLISFSVMAADKTQGWAGDSFNRYKEYRYCISVNVIGFVYSGFQAFDLAYYLVTEKHVISHHLRYYFDFSMDQIMTYLLISASSASASRVDSWVSNWGRDEFTRMISASIGMSFLAFAAFGFSSLISGYHLCTHNYT